jgi:hypothetical protein
MALWLYGMQILTEEIYENRLLHLIVLFHWSNMYLPLQQFFNGYHVSS